jgi:hypothetical protein
MMATINSYSGTLLQNGVPIAGVQVRLYNSAEEKVAATRTDKNGKYLFTNLAGGNYQIRFFGEGFTEDDYINFAVSGGVGGEAAPITFTGTPSLSVVESNFRVDEQGEISEGQFYLNNLSVSSGNIRTILIEIQENGVPGWQPLNLFKFDSAMPEVSSNLNSATYVFDIPLRDKPAYYDFRASFLNSDSVPAKSNGNIIYASQSNVEFNGIPDLLELMGVASVDVKNANESKDRLASNQIILE